MFGIAGDSHFGDNCERCNISSADRYVFDAIYRNCYLLFGNVVCVQTA